MKPKRTTTKTKPKKPSIPPPPAAAPAAPMIRLRLPSEKPTRWDGDKSGHIVVFYKTGNCCGAWLWKNQFEEKVIAWLPGRLPEGLLPKPPTQEELWRKEFEECFPDFELTKQETGEYLHTHAATAWRGFLAAKKGGQQP